MLTIFRKAYHPNVLFQDKGKERDMKEMANGVHYEIRRMGEFVSKNGLCLLHLSAFSYGQGCIC